MKQLFPFSPHLITFVFFCLFAVNSSISQPQYPATERVVVKYAPAVSEEAKQAFYQQAGGERIYTDHRQQLAVLQFPSASRKEDSPLRIQRLQQLAQNNPSILYVEPDYIFSASTNPNDPQFSQQWGLSNTGQMGGTIGADISAVSQWSQNPGNNKVVAGIIDTGIDWGHEDLVDNIWQNLAEDADGDGKTLEYINGTWQLDPGDLNNIDEDGNGYIDDLIGWDFVNNDNNPFDDNGHGTHVAGILGAKGNNTLGIAGVSWHTPMMALKAFDEKGAGSVLTIVPALAYARQMGAQLTNNSWGGPAFSQALYDEIVLAGNEDMLCIAAAGNQASNNSVLPMYPASFDLAHIISVAASDPKDSLASFSNYGYQSVDLAAPGQDIYSTIPGNQYGFKNGTSMAAPMVAGAASLLWSLGTERSNLQIKEMLLNSVDQVPGMAGRCLTGGRLNLYQAANLTEVLCEQFTVNTDQQKISSILTFDETVWFGTNYGIYESHLYTCKDTLWDNYNVLTQRHIRSLSSEDPTSQWIATHKGLTHFDGTTWTVYDESTSDIPDEKVNFVFADRGDSIWLEIDQEGLVLFDGSNWVPQSSLLPSLPDLKINAMLRDSVGALWIGHDAGIIRLKGLDTAFFDETNSGLPNEKMLSLAVDSLNHLWVGTDNGGLVHYDGTNWTQYLSNNSGLLENKVRAVAIDQEGYIWVGGPGGVQKYDGSNWLTYDASDQIAGLPHNNVHALHTDANNNVWVGTDQGAFVFSTDALMASFSAQQAPCINVPLTFQNHSVGGKRYYWMVDQVVIDSTQDISYTFSHPGDYTVSLIAENLYTTDTFHQPITVKPLPFLDLGADTIACANSILLDAGITELDYAWKDANDSLLSTRQQLKVTTSGIYHLEAHHACGTTLRDTLQVSLSGDCVWPGDVNTDGQVDILDYLSLGIAEGSSGTARSDASTQWRSEAATDWTESFDNRNTFGAAVNYKHADCNGDGIVDLQTDAAVVLQNVGFVHEPVDITGPNGIQLQVEPTLTTMMASDTFVIHYDVYLNQENGAPVSDVHGVAFTLNYNLPLSQTPQFTLDSELSDEMHGAIITYDPQNTATGSQVSSRGFVMAMGIVAKNRRNKQINGKLASMGIIVVLEDIQEDNGVMSFANFSVTPGNLIVIDSLGVAQPVSQNASQATSTVQIIFPPENNPALPLECVDFSAVRQENEVRLSWLTLHESGMETYLVQRSTDGQVFEVISSLNALGDAESGSRYEYPDTRPHYGDNFYRIQWINSEGTVHFSAIERVSFLPHQVQFHAFPNPSQGKLNLGISPGTPEPVSLQLITPLGQVRFQQILHIKSTYQTIPLPHLSLSAGIYYLVIRSSTQQEVIKIKIQP